MLITVSLENSDNMLGFSHIQDDCCHKIFLSRYQANIADSQNGSDNRAGIDTQHHGLTSMPIHNEHFLNNQAHHLTDVA